MSGGKVLEDAGYIAGNCIPIVPVYGKRWFIDNIERCMGVVRFAKDAQRLKNMQLSKLGEISALSSIEKPIMVPEQVAGHQQMWAEDNLRNYPYLLINPVTDAAGQTTLAPPVGYTKSPQIPPAMAALLQLTETDIADILGNQQNGDKIVSNISGKAVEMVQQRLDMQAFLYMSNYSKGVQRCGEIWLSMAREIYVESKRRMKGLGPQNEVESIELMRPTLDRNGEVVMENDLSQAKFDVVSTVGPSSSSQRSATVRSLLGMLQLTQDPQTQQVLLAMAFQNMEGEGISDVRGYFRKQMVQAGIMQPTPEEAEEMAAAAQNAQPDPNAQYVQAVTEEAMAKTEKARADTLLTMAKAEETQAKTMETMVGISGEGAPAAGQQQGMAPVMDEFEMAKRELELENLRIDAVAKLMKLKQSEDESARTQQATQTDSEVQSVLADTRENIKAAVDGMRDSIDGFKQAIQALAQINQQNAQVAADATEKALEVIKKPKRVIRENGRVVGIE